MSLHAGQHIAFSGHFLAPRADLAARARAAGLHVDPAVTERTDVVVANDAGSGAPAVRAAIAHGIPLLDEYSFDDLLSATACG
ncbi:DNA polymerase-3 subunit epsilon [Kineococcus radiotolerans]|uniref:DNA polymerase III n=2 Tax=Kineococcus radiotolerans TaxID=131568 RepID=A6WGF2_KINRD|nr:BRCT domain-containing protein [Kineococcus radiotolerans]ABS05891.1 putative DNA polymerase III [Kineococcus radiotolerans SRS30216 = ATCC BAA-149]MBB2901453.1 DNA polymerase-3 subunit epsilon [Kineococcus radiotolerans]